MNFILHVIILYSFGFYIYFIFVGKQKINALSLNNYNKLYI